MTPGRMEAFSDGVLAIIITIMVLDLRLPAGSSVGALRSVLPSLLAYVLSFVFIGIYWANHHHLVKTVDRVTGGILWANLDLLFWLSLFPFATRWMSVEHFARVPVITYGVVQILAAIAYYILQLVIVRSQGPDSALRTALGRDVKGKLSPVLFALGAACAFVSSWLALALYATVAITWLVPDRRLEPVIEGRPSDTGA
ncbi:MAG TPA: TMEM175 family protein [Acidimicrobiales bacterium]|nr:TMEM175 family protein [Acidimicrobiales bacterium]